MWEARTGLELLTLNGHTNGFNSVAWSPDGQRFSASEDKTVKVWEARTGLELLALKGHFMPVTSVAWSADGQRLASASEDETVKVWEARTGLELLTLKGHTGQVTTVAWSPDGQRLASASVIKLGLGLFVPVGQQVKVWAAQASHELLILKGHTNEVASVGWSPDGKRVVGTDQANVTKSWDAGTGKEIVPCEDTKPLPNTRALSPDGQRQAFVEHGRLYLGPCRLRVDELARQQEENAALTYLWHLRMAREARQQGDDHALFFHLQPLLLSFFTHLDARSQAFDPTWGQRPPLRLGRPDEDPWLLGVGANHLKRLREELDGQVAVPKPGWETWAARAWCRHLQGEAAGAEADFDQALKSRPQEPVLLSLRAVLKRQAPSWMKPSDGGRSWPRVPAWTSLSGTPGRQASARRKARGQRPSGTSIICWQSRARSRSLVSAARPGKVPPRAAEECQRRLGTRGGAAERGRSSVVVARARLPAAGRSGRLPKGLCRLTTGPFQGHRPRPGACT